MVTIEIEGLDNIPEGETLTMYANGLHIRISVSSLPVLEDAQDIQFAGNLAGSMNSDAIVAEGCSGHVSNCVAYGLQQTVVGNDIRRSLRCACWGWCRRLNGTGFFEVKEMPSKNRGG